MVLMLIHDNTAVAGTLAFQDDPRMFGETVAHHLPHIRRLAARLSPVGQADDVVQEALLRAWRRRRTFDPSRGGLSGWLLAIVANEAHRAHRARRPRLTSSGNPIRQPIDDRLDIEAAVVRLSPRQRLAVDCYYFVGLSIAETAAVMKCSEGTVKSTLSDARTRLKRDLSRGNADG